jgi:CheY-like chemotaxis protein
MESEGTRTVRLRILIVESDLAIRELLTESLTLLGQDATSVGNSSKAWGLLGQSHFDLMLVAYSLSEFGSLTLATNSLAKTAGLALAEKAREHDPGLKIIMLTGSEGEAVSTAMTKRIVDAIISKPFSLSDVEEAVVVLCASGPFSGEELCGN